LTLEHYGQTMIDPIDSEPTVQCKIELMSAFFVQL